MKYIIGAVIILAVVFYLLNQTGGKSVPHSENIVQLNIANEITEKDNSSEEEEYDNEYFELKDVGTPCKNHRYQMPSDTMESLLFSIKPDSGMTSETLQLSIKNDKVSKYGISILPEYVEIITKTVEYPIWVINADDLLADGKYYLNERKGIVSRVSSFGIKGKYLVHFFDSNSGTGILSAGHNIHPFKQEQFGGHTEEELADILGSESLLVNFTASWGTDYSWQVSQEYRTREVKIVQASVSITTPDAINGLSLFNKTFYLTFTDSSNRYRFSVSYNKKRDIYDIEGPGYDVGCLNKP